MIDARSIARWRTHTQHLVGDRWATAPQAVSGLLAVQAENHSQASWAVATRCDGEDSVSFSDAYDRGEILRTHVLRPTWHFVSPDDIRWLLTITRPRVLRQYEQQATQEGVDESTLERALVAISDALDRESCLTRRELGERLAEEGLPSGGRPLAVAVAFAELEQLICSGPLRNSEHTYALVEHRAPGARRLDPDEAMAELVLRYFTSHGPATERDLAYWATQTLGAVRAGLSSVGHLLESFEFDESTFWYRVPRPDAPTVEPRAHILQLLDEMYRGYQDSRGMIDAAGLMPGGRERSIGMLLVDGQIAGDMQRTVAADRVQFDIATWRELGDEQLVAVSEAADRYGSFLGLPATAKIRVARSSGPAT